ncbi:MAG TPA: chemotaxis protein CheB [Usitatibacter sp.]|nr:chemotaxis protein CheB [Usitatibacter sp.]
MQYDLVTIVASPRGIPALRHLLAELPSRFSTPIVCLVQSTGMLADELQRGTRLRVCWARAGERAQRGCVYLSPPGLSVRCDAEGRFGLSPFGPESSALNPVDFFLMTAASAHGARLLSLVLAGFDRDGVAGCEAVKQAGGCVLVLDRATAHYWGMAEPIVQAGAADRVLTIVEVAEALRACFTSQDLLRCAGIQVELGSVLEGAMRISGTAMGHITRRTRETDELRIVVQRGLGIEFFDAFEAMPADDETAWCQAVRLKRPVVIPDVGAAGSHPAHRLGRPLPYRAEMAVPLLRERHEAAEGALTVLFRQPFAPWHREAHDIDHLAARAADLIADIA